MKVRKGKILPFLALALVALFIGVFFYLESAPATAKLMEQQCYLAVAGWLGEQPRPPARTPGLQAGQLPGPVVGEAFDRGYYELISRYGGFQQGGPALLTAMRAYMDKEMPAPFPDLCRRIALKVAKACRPFREDRRKLGDCFAQNVDAFRYGLGRFNLAYMDDPEQRAKVEQAHLNLGF